jgi:hypothetical protein
MKDLMNTGMQFVAGKVNPLDGIISLYQEVLVVEATEKTKREQIVAEKEVKMETLRAQRDFFMEYLKKTYDERADNFAKIFEVIDGALENDNVQALALGLDSLNKLAAESPFKVIADISTLQNALENKEEFDF